MWDLYIVHDINQKEIYSFVDIITDWVSQQVSYCLPIAIPQSLMLSEKQLIDSISIHSKKAFSLLLIQNQLEKIHFLRWACCQLITECGKTGNLLTCRGKNNLSSNRSKVLQKCLQNDFSINLLLLKHVFKSKVQTLKELSHTLFLL